MDSEIESTFALMGKIVHSVRNVRQEMKIPPSTPTDLFIQAPSQEAQLIKVKKHQGILHALVRLNNIYFGSEKTPEGFYAKTLIENLQLIIPLPEEMREKERTRLQKVQEKLIKQEKQLRAKLANDSFVQKAPPELVENTKNSLAQIENQLIDISKNLEKLY